MSDGTAGILILAALALGGLLWWAKENADTVFVVAYFIVKTLFYLAVIVIGIYCLVRLLSTM
jgi:hypothetical protein